MQQPRAGIRWIDVLRILRTTYGGVLSSTDANHDLIVELLNALDKPNDAYLSMHQRLTELAGRKRIVIERTGEKITTIRLAGKQATPASTANGGDHTVPTPRGARRTTEPRDGEGRVLPAYLTDDQCSSVTVTNKATEETAIVGMTMAEALGKDTRDSLSYSDLIASFGIVLRTEYNAPSIQRLIPDVIKWLIANGHLEKGTKRQGKALVYTILRPAPSEQVDVEALIRALATELQATRTENVRLVERITELERAAEYQPSEEMLRKIATDLKAARAAEGRLNRELQGAKTQQIRTDKAHEDGMTQLQERLNEAEEQLRSARSSTLAPDITAMLEELGYSK